MKPFLLGKNSKFFVVLGLSGLVVYNIRLWNDSRTVAQRLRVTPTSEGALSRFPKLSFLVPAWNAEEYVEKHIETFQGLSYPNLELIICAGGRDKTFEVARQYESQKIRVIEQLPGEGKQKALCKSLRLATGELIFLTDIDCQPTDKLITALLQPLIEGTMPAATGSLRPLTDQEDNAFVMAQWGIVRFTARTAGTISDGMHGANSVLHRNVLEASGGFSQPAPSGTDYTLSHELTQRGYSIAYLGWSEMPASFPPTLGIYIHKQARWLRNVAVLGVRYRAWQEVKSVGMTLALPFGLSGLLLLGLKYPLLFWWPFLLILQAVLNRLRFAYMSGIKVKVSGVLATIFGDLGAAVLATYQIIRRQHKW
jgi:cellulose synthase/poly-beta-1,6-N-acetylglucosamine synthase-like glycosyltransferase